MERRKISSQTLWNLLTQALKNKFGFTLRLFERTPCFRESKTEESSLHVVVVYGEAGKISELIINERKVRTQTEVSKEMALHWVANLGKPEYCCQLATYGGSLTAEDGSEEGNSTIHFAIIHGQEEFARWQVGVCASAANKKGISPTFYATCYLHTQLVQSLVVKGASVDYQVSSHNNATPLHLAVRSGNEAMVKMLLKCGVDPHIFCSYNRTPLHWAASYGNLQILKSMETCGAELSTRTNDECGHQPIHLAAGNGHTAVVEWLLDNGVAVESPSNLGFTPLYVAAVNGQNKLVLRLLRRGAQVNRRINSDHNTILHLAASSGRLRVTQMLLHLGADVNAEGSHRYIPMHYAARNNHVDCFRKLLSFEGGKKMRNEANDCEPLVVTAAKYDSEEAAAWLLESAESTDVKDNDGLTPLHHATISDSGNAALLLMMKGADVNSKDKIF